MLGLGLGLNNSAAIRTAAQQLVNAFKARVIADGGVFEAKACLEVQLKQLSNIA